MKLQRIEGSARGRDIDIDIGENVTLIAGPTGTHKTTTLNLIPLVLAGWISARNRVIRRVNDVHSEMSMRTDRYETVGAMLHFDEDLWVRREIRAGQKPDGGTTVQTQLTASGVGTTPADIIQRIGDVSRLDVTALLGMSGPQRRKAMLDMCAPFDDGGHDLEWCKLVFEETVGEPPAGCEYVEAPSLLEALQRTVDAAKVAVREAQAEARAKQAAVDGLEERAARVPSMPGTPEDLRQTINQLNADIEAAAGQMGAVDNRRLEALERELASLLELPSEEDAQARLDQAEGALREASERLEQLRTNPPEKPKTIPHQGIAQGIAQAEERMEKASQAKWTAIERERQLRALQPGEACPTCGSDVDLQAVSAHIGDEVQAREDAKAEAEAAEAALASLRSMYDEVQRKNAQASTAFQVKVADVQREFRATQSAIDGLLTMERDQAQRMLERLSGAADRVEKIQGELERMEAFDEESIRRELEGAKTRRDKIAQALDEAIAQREARQALAQAAADRDAAAGRIPALKASVSGWTSALERYTQNLFDPFTEACAQALPEGWGLRFDLGIGGFLVARKGLPTVDLQSLSRGEQVHALAACAVGLARCAGNPWRVAIVDHAEALSPWPTPEAPNGLFGLFLDGLRRACEAGLIDQAIVACSRPPNAYEKNAAGRVIYTAADEQPGPKPPLKPKPKPLKPKPCAANTAVGHCSRRATMTVSGYGYCTQHGRQRS